VRLSHGGSDHVRPTAELQLAHTRGENKKKLNMQNVTQLSTPVAM